jgi:hypothetical protein
LYILYCVAKFFYVYCEFFVIKTVIEILKSKKLENYYCQSENISLWTMIKLSIILGEFLDRKNDTLSSSGARYVPFLVGTLLINSRYGWMRLLSWVSAIL